VAPGQSRQPPPGKDKKDKDKDDDEGRRHPANEQRR